MGLPRFPAPVERLLLGWYFHGWLCVAQTWLFAAMLVIPGEVGTSYVGGAMLLVTGVLCIAEMAAVYFGRASIARIFTLLALVSGSVGTVIGLADVLR
ncbi:MAG TPA: hypothetical protein VHC22_15345 [Pirellulales bacterium]|nr:hypothetical protein [Pirellulales bacterium]